MHVVTARKPPGLTFPDWVERQIQDAERRGAFRDLPGAGKPIPGIDRPRGDLDWVADYLRREDVDVAALLPPSLALAKEVEDLPQALRRMRSEREVRDAVTDLNRRIAAARLAPHDGPPMRVGTVDVERAVRDWADRASAQPGGRRERRPDPGPVVATRQGDAQQHPGLVRIEQSRADQPARQQVGLGPGETVGVRQDRS